MIQRSNGERSGRRVEEMFRLDSIVRGHHVYKMVWTPVLEEILTAIPEPENNHDRHAACVKKGREIVVTYRASCRRRCGTFDAWRRADLGSEWKEKVRKWARSPLCIEVHWVQKFTGSNASLCFFHTRTLFSSTPCIRAAALSECCEE